MDFTEIQQGCLILEELNRQRVSNHFCDVTFILSDSTQFPAHRNILAASSPYFKALLHPETSEKETLISSCSNSMIFSALIDYIYTGRVVIEEHTVSEFMRLATTYMLNELKSYCCSFLEKHISTHNCFAIRDLADSNNCKLLLHAIDTYISDNIAKVIHENELMEFPLSHLRVIMELFQKSLTDEIKFELIMSWVTYDLSHRETFLGVLIKGINWPSFPLLKLPDMIKKNNLLTKSSRCIQDLIQELHMNNVPLSANLIHSLEDTQQPPCIVSKCYEGSITFENIKAIKDVPVFVTDLEDHDEMRLMICEDAVLDEPGLQEIQCLSTSDNVNDNSPKEAQQAPVQASKRIKISKTTKRVNPRKKSQKKEKCTPAILIKNKSSSKNPKGKNSESTQPAAIEIAPIADYEIGNQADADDGVSDSPKVKPELKVCIRCYLCEYDTEMPDAFYDHMVTKHYTEGPPYKCMFNGCTFSSQELLTIVSHNRKLHYPIEKKKDSTVVCQICSRSFNNSSSLNAHMKLHTGEKPFCCHVCARSFATKGTLKQHMATHSDEQPYECHICDFKTKYQSHLTQHRKQHKGEMFLCDHPGCSYSTPKQSQLVAHKRTHSGVRNHKCKECGKTFIEPSHLRRHQKIHLTERPYKCQSDGCKYSTTRLDKLKEHSRKKHKDRGDTSGLKPMNTNTAQGTDGTQSVVVELIFAESVEPQDLPVLNASKDDQALLLQGGESDVNLSQTKSSSGFHANCNEKTIDSIASENSGMTPSDLLTYSALRSMLN